MADFRAVDATGTPISAEGDDEGAGRRLADGLVDRMQRRCEVLAALLLAGVVSAWLQLVAQVIGILRNGERVFEWTGVLREGLYAADLLVAVLLLGAYVLIVLGPGARIGRLGSRLLHLVQWIGIALTLMAGGAAVGILRGTGDDSGSLTLLGPGPNLSDAELRVSKIGLMSPYLVAGAITGFVAWSALQARKDGLTDRPSAPD